MAAKKKSRKKSKTRRTKARRKKVAKTASFKICMTKSQLRRLGVIS